MSKRRLPALAVALGAILLSGCATRDEVRALRSPAMPPLAVAKASPGRAFYRNVSIQEVQGAPEFRWFDGGAVLTTRPTRKQVTRRLNDMLGKADMLAPSRLDSEYMLYVKFDELRGPNVWLGSDKLASARMSFRLVRWRTGEVVAVRDVETSYRVHWIGVTPEMARAAIAGPLGLADDSPFAPPGGALLGLALGFYVNETQVADIYDAPIAGEVGGLQAGAIGGDSRVGNGYGAAFLTALAVGGASGSFTNFEAMLAGGAISAAGAAAGPIPVLRDVGAGDTATGVLNGTTRRFAANDGLLKLAFDDFMTGLSRDGSVTYKTAVSCRSLNPERRRGAHLAGTSGAYGVDCPGANYNESPSQRAYPAVF